jgi:hypothetical protein
MLIPNKHIINDEIYNLEDAQDKINIDQEMEENMENVVSNGAEGDMNV